MQVKMQRGPDGQVQSQAGQRKEQFYHCSPETDLCKDLVSHAKDPQRVCPHRVSGIQPFPEGPRDRTLEKRGSKGPIVQVFGAVHWKGDRFVDAQALLLALCLGLTPGGAQGGQMWYRGVKPKTSALPHCTVSSVQEVYFKEKLG